MKKYLVFILMILLLMICASCEGNFGKSDSTYFLTKEDHSRGYTYPVGHYYVYAVATYDEQVQPITVFHSLEADNIIVKEGWYRPYLTGCSAPGSGRTTTSIYSNVLIVRLDEAKDSILKHKFRVLGSPQPIACGYDVSHYMLHR